MPKQVDYTLSNEELEQIRESMKDRDTRVSKRATVIHRLHLGDKPQAIANSHDISLASVYNYFNRFKADGRASLVDQPRSGRPPKATDTYVELLAQTLERNPQEMGFAFTIWTQARLSAYLAEQTGISLSRARFHELMRQSGYVYRRPKYDVAHKQDESLRDQVTDTLDELKKEPKHGKSNYSLWMKV